MANKITKYAPYCIFPLLFNVLFFVIGGFDHPASVWISYSWIQAAYVLAVFAAALVPKTQSKMIFTATTAPILWAYFCIEFIIGMILIFVAAETVRGPILIQFVPACIFALVYFSMGRFNQHTAANEQRRAVEVSFIKTAASKAKIVMDNVSDPALKNKLEKLYDLIHSSPSRSYPSVRELENSVMMLLNDLAMSLDENDVDEMNKLIRKIMFTMEERNRIVSLSYE